MQLKCVFFFLIACLPGLFGESGLGAEESPASSWRFAFLSGLELSRYKPLEKRLAGKAVEEASLPSQQIYFGLLVRGCGTTACLDSVETGNAHFIYDADFALAASLGDSDQISGTDSELLSSAFVPGDRLFTGLEIIPQESVWGSRIASRFVVGRSVSPSPLEDRLLGHAGSLTGGFLELEERDYGRLRIILHKPILAGDFLGEDQTLYKRQWVRALRLERETEESMAERVDWSFSRRSFYIGFYYDMQRRSSSVGRQLRQESRSLLQEPQASTQDIWQGATAKATDSFRYVGLGMGFSNHATKKAAQDSIEEASATGGIRYDFFLNMERLDGKLYSLLKDEEGRYETQLRAHALRSGFSLGLQGWFLAFDFFLPTPSREHKGSLVKKSEESGYVGFGRNPARGRLMRRLDMRPWYEPCSPLAPGLPGCDRLQKEKTGPSLRRPSAVAYLSLGYRNERFRLNLEASLIQPLALQDSRSPSNPFARLKKDSLLFSYRELGVQLDYRLSSDGSVQLRYDRLYRIRPENPESPLRRRQTNPASLMAEGFSIYFSKKVF